HSIPPRRSSDLTGHSGIICAISVPPLPVKTLDKSLSTSDRPVAWHHFCHPSRRQDTDREHLRQGHPGCARSGLRPAGDLLGPPRPNCSSSSARRLGWLRHVLRRATRFAAQLSFRIVV